MVARMMVTEQLFRWKLNTLLTHSYHCGCLSFFRIGSLLKFKRRCILKKEKLTFRKVQNVIS